jgi:exodeoxyribonuclease-3
MRIISWNVNGIRGVQKNGFMESLRTMDPDITCFQETKAQDEQVKETLFGLGYEIFVNSAVRKGYSGTAILTKTQPHSVQYGIGIEEHDQEGRVITLEYESFFLITVYVPNSGNELLRLSYRTSWDNAFLQFLKSLEAKKPVIVCGDFNVAHTDIDLANPKPNYNKSAGYMQEEIDGMDAFVAHGWLDSFRHFHPEEVKYTWWSYRAGARERNVGWRIDYFLVSQSFLPQVKNAFILNEIWGSDHCPVGIEL